MFQDKKIFILGMARSGYAAAKVLAKYNNSIIVFDDKKDQDANHIDELTKLGVSVLLGEQKEDIFDETFDFLIKNPGVPLEHRYILLAEKYNIPVINEVEMAYHLFPKDIKIVAITGTNGKTTTTTLIYEILRRTNNRVHLVGNIGFPVSSFVDIVKKGDILVMEISAQQLINVYDFKADIAVLTNLFEAHLDFMETYKKYLDSKLRIFNHHSKENIAVLNLGNDDVVTATKDIKSTKIFFSSKEKINGAYLLDNDIYYNDEKIINVDDIKLSGVHNYENIMAAIIVSKQFKIDNSIIREVLNDFAGVEHRLEYVRKINNIEFYNDSKATNIKATQIALGAFAKPVTLILGGMDRGQNFMDLTSDLKHVKLIVCYGESKERIKKFADTLKTKCVAVDMLEEAVKVSYNLSDAGEIVLLSPACASWDQFKDFEERGRLFKEYVEKL